MKHIENFESFINESLMSSKANKKDELALLAISKKTGEDALDDFRDEFTQMYNTAADMWMNDDMWIELKKMYATGKDDFLCIGGESVDGSEDSKMEKARKDGWSVFADEQNYENYDAILHKSKVN